MSYSAGSQQAVLRSGTFACLVFKEAIYLGQRLCQRALGLIRALMRFYLCRKTFSYMVYLSNALVLFSASIAPAFMVI